MFWFSVLLIPASSLNQFFLRSVFYWLSFLIESVCWVRLRSRFFFVLNAFFFAFLSSPLFWIFFFYGICLLLSFFIDCALLLNHFLLSKFTVWVGFFVVSFFLESFSLFLESVFLESVFLLSQLSTLSLFYWIRCVIESLCYWVRVLFSFCVEFVFWFIFLFESFLLSPSLLNQFGLSPFYHESVVSWSSFPFSPFLLSQFFLEWIFRVRFFYMFLLNPLFWFSCFCWVRFFIESVFYVSIWVWFREPVFYRISFLLITCFMSLCFLDHCFLSPSVACVCCLLNAFFVWARGCVSPFLFESLVFESVSLDPF